MSAFSASMFTGGRTPIRFTFGLLAATGLLCIGLGVVLVWFVGSANPFTPAGYVGYLTKGAFLGQSRYYGIQRGPTSPGRTWLQAAGHQR